MKRVSTATIILSVLLMSSLSVSSTPLFGDPEEDIHNGVQKRETNSGAVSKQKYPPVPFYPLLYPLLRKQCY